MLSCLSLFYIKKAIIIIMTPSKKELPLWPDATISMGLLLPIGG